MEKENFNMNNNESNDLSNNQDLYMENYEQNNSLPNKIPAFLAITAAAAGIVAFVWYAFYPNMQNIDNKEIPVLKADNSPVKVKPTEPGGMVVPNMDKTVYDNLASNNAETHPKVERVLPAPEEPVDAAKIISKGEDIPTLPAVKDPKAVATNKTTNVADNNDNKTQEAKVNNPKEVALSKNDQSTITHKASDNIVEKKELSNFDDKAALVKASPKAKVSAYKVQLASFKNTTEATNEWNKISAKNKAIIGDYGHLIERKDLGDKGVYYRLQAGPIKSESEARMLCKKLSENGQSCLVVKP